MCDKNKMDTKSIVVSALKHVDPECEQNIRVTKGRVSWSLFPAVILKTDVFTSIMTVCRFRKDIVFVMFSTISLLLSNKIPFNLPNCLKFVEVCLHDSTMNHIMCLPMSRSFTEESMLDMLCVYTKNGEQMSKKIVSKCVSLYTKNPIVFSNLMNTRVLDMRGSFRKTKSHLMKICMMTQEMFNLFEMRLIDLQESHPENFIKDFLTEFGNISQTLKNAKSIPHLNVSIRNDYRGFETRLVEHEAANTPGILISKMFQVYTKIDGSSHVFIIQGNVYSHDGSVTVFVPRLYDQKIVSKSELLFIPGLCAYTMVKCPEYMFSTCDFRKATQNSKISFKCRTKLSHTIVPTSKVNVIHET